MTPSALKAMRVRLGYQTQLKLAEALGVSVRTVQSWEQGARPVPKWVKIFLELLQEIKEEDE